MDEILRLKKLTGLSESKLLFFIGVNKQRFIEWKDCYGNPPVKRNVPKSHWATETEIMAVIEFKKANIEEGYKRLTWMMVDTNIVYLSPSTVYRILVRASLNNRWTKPTCEPKKRGFEQPVRLHEHWHTDISYINFKGTFLYLICVLDGFSRAILKWDIRESMESFDVIVVLWGACCDWVFETENKPRIISDNGSQFISYEFKEALRDSGLTHSRTSVNHPQSNGKIERFHGTAKQESLRNMPKFSIEQVKKEFGEWIDFYNTKRLHSAINYVAPFDVINGNRELILAERKRKLEIGKENRRLFFQDLL